MHFPLMSVKPDSVDPVNLSWTHALMHFFVYKFLTHPLTDAGTYEVVHTQIILCHSFEISFRRNKYLISFTIISRMADQ